MFLENCEIVSNISIADEIYKMVLNSEKIAKTVKPGQFLHVRVSNDNNPLLRRPFSIYDAGNDFLSILYSVRGLGTKILSKRKPGEYLDVLGALGKSFDLPSAKNCLLLAGGIGIAPLYYLSKQLKEKKNNLTLLFGVREGKDAGIVEDIQKLCSEVHVSSEDGKAGQRGFITDIKINYSEFENIFICGPRLMIKRLNELIRDINANCQVSLEENMACGIGTCLGCVCETKRGYERVCAEGPVFNIKDIVW